MVMKVFKHTYTERHWGIIYGIDNKQKEIHIQCISEGSEYENFLNPIF